MPYRFVRATEYDRLRQMELRAHTQRMRARQLKAINAMLSDRIRELEATVVNMKKEGFEAPAKMPAIEDVAIHSAVLEALEEVAPPGSPYRQQELALAISELQAGEDPSEVARRMRQGGDVNIWSTGRLRDNGRD